MLQRDAGEFFRKLQPFSRLDDRTRGRLVESLKIELYPAGAQILAQGDLPTGALHVVKQGLVRIHARTASGQELVLDFRGVGETFGFLAHEAARPHDAGVQAVSDTICYVLDGAQVRGLLEQHPALREFLLPGYFPQRDEHPAPAPVQIDTLRDGSERFLFTSPVRDLASREVVTVALTLPVREAASLMSVRRIGAVVVVAEGGAPAGIVTTTDLRDRVLVGGADPATPVAEIMSAPLVTVEGREACYEALLKMLGHDIRHLPVTESGRLAGIVSSGDFMILQGTSPLVIAREIEGQATVEGLAVSARRVLGLITLLLGAGAGAGSIIRVITSVNDRIERKILEIAVQALGPPPLPFCWIVHGSAGRKEQTFKTDQDNALIWRDPDGPALAQAAADYFGRFAEFVVDAALRCGFARCEGDFMATNPRWRQPLAEWRRIFRVWIETPVEDAIHNASNFFDFRGLHGDLDLAAQLKSHLMGTLPRKLPFLTFLAAQAQDYRPPLGVFGSLVVEKGGDHPRTLDIKKNCLVPLVNLVRLYSFESLVPETCTVDRIAALKGIHPTVSHVGDDLRHAFEFLALLRIRHQHERITTDREPDNHINPKKLSSLEQRSLREICRLLGQLLDEVGHRYDLGRRV